MMDDTITPDPSDVEKNKVMAILAYLGCLCLVPLLAAKDSPFARFHTNQGLTLLLGWIIIGTLDFMVSMWIVTMGLLAVRLGMFVLSILGIVNAAGGKMQPLPLIGGITLLK